MPRRLALFITLLILCCAAAAQQNWCRITGEVILIDGEERVFWKSVVF